MGGSALIHSHHLRHCISRKHLPYATWATAAAGREVFHPRTRFFILCGQVPHSTDLQVEHSSCLGHQVQVLIMFCVLRVRALPTTRLHRLAVGALVTPCLRRQCFLAGETVEVVPLKSTSLVLLDFLRLSTP